MKTVTGETQTEIIGLQNDTLYFGKVIAVYNASASNPSNCLETKTYAHSVQTDPSATVQIAAGLGLGSHSTTNGITYTYIGGTPPSVGSVLFSEDEGGAITLRTVDSVNSSGGTITVNTSDATVSDALNRASIYTAFQLFDIESEAGQLDARKSKVASAKCSVSQDGTRYSRIDWKNGLLSAEQVSHAYDESGLTVTPDGKETTIELRVDRAVSSSFTAEVSAEFEPELITEAEWGGVVAKRLESGRIAAKGTLTLKALAEYNFSASGTVSKEFNLFEKTWTSVYSAGPVPVYQEIILTMDVAASAAAEAKIRANASATLTETLEIGATYDGDTWTAYIDSSEQKELTASLDIVGGATAEIRLIPKIKISFYKLISSSLTVEPYLGSSLAFEETTNNPNFLLAHPERLVHLTEFDAFLSIEANISVDLSAFDYTWEILPSTCVLGTGECLVDFDEFELFSIPELSPPYSVPRGYGQVTLVLEVKDGTFNEFDSDSVEWEAFPDDGTLSTGYCSRSGTATTCTAVFDMGFAPQYTVFVSGHGILGEMGRQFKEWSFELPPPP